MNEPGRPQALAPERRSAKMRLARALLDEPPEGLAPKASTAFAAASLRAPAPLRTPTSLRRPASLPTPASISAGDLAAQSGYSDHEFGRIARLLERHAGIELSASKRQMAFNRLIELVRREPYGGFAHFLDAVERGQRAELERFVNALTTNVTAFNREPHHLQLLTTHLRTRGLANASIWSAGCSSGQEVWSIVLALDKAFGTPALCHTPFQLIGSDVDTEQLTIAQRAVYSRSQIAELGPNHRDHYFEPVSEGPADSRAYRLRAPWRELAAFRHLNLGARVRADYFADQRFDAIFCRNVMIYFSADAQRRVLEALHRSLKPNGLLFVGHSEALGHGEDLFTPLGQTSFMRRGYSQ